MLIFVWHFNLIVIDSIFLVLFAVNLLVPSSKNEVIANVLQKNTDFRIFSMLESFMINELQITLFSIPLCVPEQLLPHLYEDL